MQTETKTERPAPRADGSYARPMWAGAWICISKLGPRWTFAFRESLEGEPAGLVDMSDGSSVEEVVDPGDRWYPLVAIGLDVPHDWKEQIELSEKNESQFWRSTVWKDCREEIRRAGLPDNTECNTPSDIRDLTAQRDAARRDRDAFQADALRLQKEADGLLANYNAALSEANRRDAKWKAGINAACGEEIDFDPGSDPTENSLDAFVLRLKGERDQACIDFAGINFEIRQLRKDRDAALKRAEDAEKTCDRYAAELDQCCEALEKWPSAAGCNGRMCVDGHLKQILSHVASLEQQLAGQTRRAEESERANRTRPDYDIRCQQCGRAHILDTSIPSKTWNQIADPSDILCTTCIDERLASKGLEAEAEFYFVGKAMKSRLYDESHGDVEAAERRIAALEQQLADLRTLPPLPSPETWYGVRALANDVADGGDDESAEYMASRLVTLLDHISPETSSGPEPEAAPSPSSSDLADLTHRVEVIERKLADAGKLVEAIVADCTDEMSRPLSVREIAEAIRKAVQS